MSYLSFSYEKALDFIEEKELTTYKDLVPVIHETIHNRSGKGSQYLGWLYQEHDIEEIMRIEAAAERIQADSDILIVIGVGGSYLGAHAAIKMLGHSFEYMMNRNERSNPHIIFVGHHLSSTYKQELFEVLEGLDVSINVISKSGTTTEPAIAFRIFRAYMEDKYGKQEAKKRIYVTTDRKKGALKEIADQNGYEQFIIPDDIGGRYSVLTPVGLLPMAVSGIAIDEVLRGKEQATKDLEKPQFIDNPAYEYAALRHILYSKGITTEILVNYEPKLKYFAEWWKQLYGESEGKDHKGIFPASANFTTDLHSFGQYIQDGRQPLFETVLSVVETDKDLYVTHDDANLDGLNYLAGKSLHEINDKAREGAMLAHVSGGVPNLEIRVPKLDAYTFGYMVYFFMKSCAMSGYILGVNPFDQPGVDAYKHNMFALLGKPGFENKKEKLETIFPKKL